MTDAMPTDRVVRETVRETLARRLPSDGRVAAIGTEPSTADWLAERSVVTVVTPGDSPSRGTVGARVTSLPFADEAFDAVCWLGDGPSAYTTQSDRTDAIAEAARIVPPDAPVIIAGLGRIAAFRLAFGCAPEAAADAGTRLLDDGRFTAERLGHPAAETPVTARLPFHAYRLDEFEAELVNQPLAVRRVLGLDGALLGVDQSLETLSAERLSAVGRAVRGIGGERAVADGSFRLLAVGRKLPNRSLDTEPSLV